jgi:serine/threonine protein phosphatase PrpC
MWQPETANGRCGVTNVSIRKQACGRATQDRAETIETPSALVVVLADGAGGMGGGAEAADLLVQTAKEWVGAAEKPPDETDWCLWLAEMDSALERDRRAGETTGVCLSISASGIAGASVGDSEAWLLDSTGTIRLTRRQRRKPLLGSGEAFPVPFTARDVSGDLLVASDGLFNYTSAEQIERAFSEPNPARVTDRLIELVRLRSGEFWDDVTVVVLRDLVSVRKTPP